MKVTKSLVTSYQSPGGYLSYLPSHQLPVTSHQEDIYQTDEQRYQKRREGGYLSDNID